MGKNRKRFSRKYYKSAQLPACDLVDLDSELDPEDNIRYVLEQFRKYRTTDQTLCKAREEMHYLGQTYLCYLQSRRNYQRIRTEYTGRGERSVSDTANLVGFKLPHDPK